MRAFQDYLLGPIKAVLVRALQQQLAKYIHNIELEELGLMGGEIVLENLELKKDVLHESLRIPTDYDFSRGFIKELRISIPWTRLQSRPIEMKFKTVEIIITPITHTSSDQSRPSWLYSRTRSGDDQASTAGAATGWMQQLLTKVLANMSVSVSNLVLKYEDADVVLSAALKSLVCFSANPDRDWTPAFASLDDTLGLLHKLVRASDLTVCLDRYCDPDPSKRRQVQAFEVPIVNRASFDVRVLGCVWLVAPGPPESLLAAWEDHQHAYADGQNTGEEDGGAVPSSPGNASVRWGLLGDSPKASSTPKSSRAAVSVLGRLVGGERRSSSGADESAVDGTSSGTSVVLATEGEFDELPLPCACRLLKDGWSRRASSSYSPFFDGEGVWSRGRGEAAGYSAEPHREGVSQPSGVRRREAGEVEGGDGGGEDWMPVPTIVADVVIDALCFSLSNLQVRMMEELIDRAVNHVAQNASKSTSVSSPAAEIATRPSSKTPTTVGSSWWPSSYWLSSVPGGEDSKQGDNSKKSGDPEGYDGSRDGGSSVPSETQDRDANFVVASVSIGSVSFRLLEHQAQQHQQHAAGLGLGLGSRLASGLRGTRLEKEGVGVEVGVGEVKEGGKEEEKIAVDEDEEPQSISVPVHGLGTVSVPSTPASRKPSLRPPIAFVVAEVKGLALDAHVIPAGDKLSVDVQIEVTSVAVRQAPPDGTAGSIDCLQPIVSWGTDADANSNAVDADTADNDAPSAEVADGVGIATTGNSARNVRRCLIERARGPRRESVTIEAAEGPGSPASPEAPRMRRVRSFPGLADWTVLLQRQLRRRTMAEGCALQYRLMKRREGGGAAGDAALGAGRKDLKGTTSTNLANHDLAAGALRVRIEESLLERMLNFIGRGKRDEEPQVEVEMEVQSELSSVVDSAIHRQGDFRAASGVAPSKISKSLPPRSAAARRQTLQPSSATTSEISLHISVRSVEAALELPCSTTVAVTDFSAEVEGKEGEKNIVNALEIDDDLFTADRYRGAAAAFLVLSLSRLEINASESNTSVVAVGAPKEARTRRGITVSSPGPREDSVCQRACSFSLGDLSVVVVDGSNLAAFVAAEEPGRSASGSSASALAEHVFAAVEGGTITDLQRLIQVGDARANAKILITSSGERYPKGSMSTRTAGAARNPPEILFNASCGAVHVCASRGAAVAILEACVLGTNIWSRSPWGEVDRRGSRDSPSASLRANISGATGREQLWCRGFRALLVEVRMGGTVKDSIVRLTGDMRRLGVTKVGEGGRADVALFEDLPGEGAGEGLSYNVEVAEDGRGSRKIKLATGFKSGFIDYVKTKRAVMELKGLAAECKSVAAAVGLFDIGGSSPPGDTGLANGGGGAPESAVAPVEFDIRGSSVTMHLPFELRLEVDGVRVSTRSRSPRQSAIEGDDGLDLDLVAGDVRVFQALHGTRRWSRDVQPPSISCSARGIVTTRPSLRKVRVALDSERVRVRLTPGFCASFGSFVRFMVGPPARSPPPADNSTTSGTLPEAIVPECFTFEMKLREADVDFLASPCNPGAVSSNVVVGGVSMSQTTLGAASPGEGSRSSFVMSFKSVSGTQRRDARRNAPDLPQVAERLISAFLEPTPKSSNTGDDSDEDVERGADLFSAWVSAKRKEGTGGSEGVYVQPFIIPVEDATESPTARAFSVVVKTWGPRHRLINSLSLRLAPTLLACYPPTFRELVSSYNRFGGNAFRSFRSRADMPPKRTAVVHYDVDIRGCGAVLLASLADGARGIHVSAGLVEVKEVKEVKGGKEGVTLPSGSRPVADDDTVLAISGFVGPVEMAFVQDWRSLLLPPSGGRDRGLGGGAIAVSKLTAMVGNGSSARTTPLCAPIDMRWVVSYDRTDRCRQDVSLSSVQLYFEQPHFDLFVRVAQIFLAADYPGALSSKSPRKLAGGRAEIDGFLAVSLRLSLLQIVLAMGKKNGPLPPVLEIDVASVRLARGGVLTVRHVSLNSWSQQDGAVDSALRGGVSSKVERGDRGGCGYCVLTRSGHSEDSGRDFARMEVRVQEVPQSWKRKSLPPLLPQLDVVFQVEPFHVHINPSFLRSLTSYVTPIPFAEESPEATEVPFPHPRATFAAARFRPSTSAPSSGHARANSAAPGDEDLGQASPGSSIEDEGSTDFERSAMTASASVRLLSSQLSLELSSYPGGPSIVVSTSHVFLRALRWPSDSVREKGRGGEVGERRGRGAEAQTGPEMFARLTRVTCSIECCRDDGGSVGATGAATLPVSRIAAGQGVASRLDQQVLAPLDMDVHVTTRSVVSSGLSRGRRKRSSCWHAAIGVDELSLKFGAAHTKSLELLAEALLPVIAAAERTAAELSRGGSDQSSTAGIRGAKTWRRANDLQELERIDSGDWSFEGEALAKLEPGKVVFYGMSGAFSATDNTAADGKEVAGGAGDDIWREDGWVKCCEWCYQGLRRVVQVVLPIAPLRGSAKLYEGLVLDSLEVELSFLDPLTGAFVAAARFNVPCNVQPSPDFEAPGLPRVTVEPSQPCFATTWRLAWRIPAWLRPRMVLSAPPEPSAVCTWSSLLARSLSVHSSPAGSATRSSYFSANLITQRFALALLTDGEPPSQSSLSPPTGGIGSRGSGFLQSEEILRVTSSNVNVQVEVEIGSATSPVWAASGSALVNVEVQDFGNLLRLPLLSHALLNWNISGRGGNDHDLLSPFRPVVAASAGVHGAVVNVSVTAIQCLDRCVGELLPWRPSAREARATGDKSVINAEAPAETATSTVSSPAASRIQSRQRSKRYVIENFTDRTFWFGQVSTTETLLLRAGEDRCYRWRKIPAPVKGEGGSAGNGSRLGLLLRLALRHDSDSGFGAWTEPFLADQAGTFMRLLRSAKAGERADLESQGADGIVLPVWISVTTEGLLKRIALHGEWLFTNHLPQEVQVAWATSPGVRLSNAGRGPGEPAGTRGGLTLAGCGPDKASDGLDPGQEAEVPRPPSLSALTACASPSSRGQEHGGQERGRVSELMLEFRLAAPGASAVVGSVGPPPMSTAGTLAIDAAGEERGGGVGGGDRSSSGGSVSVSGGTRSRRESDINEESEAGSVADSVTSAGRWAVTRQSEWVEAKPGVHVALISCASPEPMSAGFWFWCVASRQAPPLSDCSGCVSRSTGRRSHLGQMKVDLRPVAVVWNRCSQPMRVVLTGRGGRGVWPEHMDAEEKERTQCASKEEEEARVSRHRLRRWSNVLSPFRPSGWKKGVRPGGRVAVCNNPFVDYDLALSSPENGRPDEDAPRPLLVSLPSELLSRRCASSWLPLHSRALMDNVLCPLVVVASRVVDSHWPSLSLRVYPGLSVQNHLPVALSLRAVFERPLTEGENNSERRKSEPVEERRGNARDGAANDHNEDSGSPLLRPRVSLEKKASSSSLASMSGSGRGGGAGLPRDASRVRRITRIFRASAESRHSAWDMSDVEGVRIPYLLPTVSLDLGLDSAGENSTAFFGSSVNPSDAEHIEREAAASSEPDAAVIRRSRTLKFRLDRELNELVLVPWKTGSGAVIPAVVKMERELLLGGVELIRLEVHPRVVVHNTTGFPISVSLLQRANAHASESVKDEEDCDDDEEDYDGDMDIPACRVDLAPEGRGSSMAILALPNVVKGTGRGKGRSLVEGEGEEVDELEDPDGRRVSTGSRGGISRSLAWLLSSTTYGAAPPQPPGFVANIEVALDRQRTDRPGDVDDDKPDTSGAVNQGQHMAMSRSAVVCLHEASGDAFLRCDPARLTAATDGGRRTVGVCVAVVGTPEGGESSQTGKSPTRHVVLHHPPPSLVVINRSAGPVTLLFDCGALVEVWPGCTAEHSWESAVREESGGAVGGVGSSAGSSPSGLSSATLARGASASTPLLSRRGRGGRSETRSRGASDSSGVPLQSSTAAMKASAAKVGTPRNRSSFGSGSGKCTSKTPMKARSPRKLGGDATLQHWFQCKGGRLDDESFSWSEPYWVARGVQVIRFARLGNSGAPGEFHEESWNLARGEEEKVREVQMHVMERAGGFVMSFAEGGFEDDRRPDADEVEGTAAAEDIRGVLRRWASTVEQHLVVSISGTIIQLLDETNLQAAGLGQTELGSRARAGSSEGSGMADGWIGGTWDGPGGLLSDGASVQLPAAAIPAILSVFLDASSARLWRAAPAVWPGMSMLDLERSWHLKDRVGVDVSVGTLQIDNHMAGHSLPVLFCFRKGGRLVDTEDGEGSSRRDEEQDGRENCHLRLSLVIAEPWEHSGVLPYMEKLYVRSAPIDVCLEDVLVEPLLQFTSFGGSVVDASSFSTTDRGSPAGWPRANPAGPRLPSALGSILQTRVFIQRVDIGALVVRATVQGYIPGKQVFLSLDKSPLLFSPVVMRGVLARPDEIAEQIASNYAVDALFRSLAVVGSLEALGSPTTLISEWGKGVYDLFAMPINAIPQGPFSTVRATFRGVSSLLRHASVGTLSSVSGVTNALSRNLETRGGVVRPIAGTMGLVHRTSRSLIASTGVDSEWCHAEAATRATPAVCRLNADLWYRWCLLPPGHEFLYRTPALCSNASYSQATVPVTIVLSSQAVFLYRGGSGCEKLWKKIHHEDITLVEQSAEHAPVELILNARAYRRLRSAASLLSPTSAGETGDARPTTGRAATAAASGKSLVSSDGVGEVGHAGVETVFFGAEEVEIGGLLMKLSLPNSACCRELAQLLHGLTDKT